jgi:SAM-dependent methyltransferase
MNHFVHGVVRAVAETFELPGPILEVGSYQVEGQEGIANLRNLFPAKKHLGVDLRPGPGVDRVADVEDLPFPSRFFGTVLALNTFEHVRHFWRGFEEIYRVLRPDGALLVSVPFYFHIHDFPSDYWRFTPAALSVLLDDYPTRILGWHGPEQKPIGVWAVAFREEAPALADERIEQYRRALMEYAREPLRWTRRLRYLLGCLLCGNRPFTPYLQQDRWRIEVQRKESNDHGRTKLASSAPARSAPRAEAILPRGPASGVGAVPAG